MGASISEPSLGAYVLVGDPTWLRSSLARYYDLLDDLVVLVPEGHRSWAGRPLPVEACLDAVREVDHRGLARTVTGAWTAPDDVVGAETAQRQAGLTALRDCDWVLQVDNDEVLPDTGALLAAIEQAGERGIPALEWPMRCLYRQLRGTRFLEVVGREGERRFDYPGPVAVRPGVELVDCRRTGGRFVRMLVEGDAVSLQVARPATAEEVRIADLTAEQAIVHNTWGRRPGVVWAKVRSSSHRLGLRGAWYFGAVWLLSPLTWRWLRDVHPFAHGLWPRLAPAAVPPELLAAVDRAPRAQTKRLA